MQFDHIGLLVRDAKKTADFFNLLHGDLQWEYVSYVFAKEVLTVGKPFKILTANAIVNGIKTEIIEPTEGEGSYMKTYLEQNGEGLHHYAYRFDTEQERSAMVEKLLAQGHIAVHASERRPGHKSHYIAAKEGGMVYELFV